MNKATHSITIITTLLTLSACGRQTPTVEAIDALSTITPIELDSSVNSSVTETYPSKIIGSNELVKIKGDGSNLEASLRGYIDAIGFIAMGQRGSCSGTHLGNGYVLTAGHCFLDTTTPGAKSVAGQACADVKVYWRYAGSVNTGNAKPAVSAISTCTKIIYAELTTSTDFAIFKVDQAPKAKIAIAIESARTKANTKLTIFGYPQGRPLEWSQYCPLVNISAAGMASSIKGASSFAHQCDTEPGNSGSSIIAISTSGAKVMGVHDGSTPAQYNYGTYMYDIRTILKTKGFDLDRSTAASGLSI